MGVRKNILYMPSDERNAFFEALLRLKAHIVNPAAPVADQFSIYDQFTSLHYGVFEGRLDGPRGSKRKKGTRAARLTLRIGGQTIGCPLP